MKNLLCEKYFENKVKPKHLSEFKETTPKGNTIEGYLCRKPNKYLGSLVITHVTESNGKSYDVEQFIQSFPKIYYWDDRHRLSEEYSCFCYEKLDGTCLIIYPLKNNHGEVIEIVPKSRSKAVLDKHILEMYDLIDKRGIFKFYEDYNKKSNDVLIFELYGVLNKHEIFYADTYIDISFIGAYVNGNFLEDIRLSLISEIFGFYLPDYIYRVNKEKNSNEFTIIPNYKSYKLKEYLIPCNRNFPTIYDAIQEVKSLLEQINKEYYKYNNRQAIEGIVINGRHTNDTQMYLKLKPSDVENESKNKHGISRRFILKEVNKYFDEYGSQVKEIYEDDESHYVDYVKKQLSEEFSFEQIEDPRTRKRIKKVFMDVWDSKLPPKSLQNICDELYHEFPDENISFLMKTFANRYPSKKQQSRHVYNILSKMI